MPPPSLEYLIQTYRSRAARLLASDIPAEKARGESLEQASRELLIDAIPNIEQKLASGELAKEFKAAIDASSHAEDPFAVAVAKLLRAYVARTSKWLAASATERRDAALIMSGQAASLAQQAAELERALRAAANVGDAADKHSAPPADPPVSAKFDDPPGASAPPPPGPAAPPSGADVGPGAPQTGPDGHTPQELAGTLPGPLQGAAPGEAENAPVSEAP